MYGVYDRFNKDLSNGIRAVDAGEEITAMRIIKTDLLEIVKLMEMHRQNQIKREEETEAKTEKMKKYYYSEEGMEAEKAKWRQIYYSSLKEKEKVDHEEEEASFKVYESESECKTIPPSSLSEFEATSGGMTVHEEEDEVSSEFSELESESESKLQLPPPMLPPSQPTPPPTTPPLSSPSLPRLPSPPPLESENRKEATILIPANPNQNNGKMEVHMFDGYRPPPPTPPPPLSGILSKGKRTMDSMPDQVGTNQFCDGCFHKTECELRYWEITAPLVDGRKEEILGFCKNELKRDKWAAINFMGSPNAEHIMDLMGNVFNLSPNLIVSAMTLTTKVKQRSDPRYFHVTLTKLTRQLLPIPQSYTFVSLLPIEPQSATFYSTTKPTALSLEVLAYPNIAFKTLGFNIGSLSSTTSSKPIKNFKGEHDKNEFLSNLVDSPGHVDFSTEITVVLCITNGVLASVDCGKDVGTVEKAISCQNFGEIIHLFLTVNKRDKYFSEHQVKEEESYQTLQRITEDSNVSWSKHQGPLLGDIMVPQEKGNVALSTGLHGWVFTLTDFAKTYDSKFGIYKSKKNIRQDYQRGPILTKLNDDLKSDEKTLYARGVARTVIWVDEYSSTEGAPADPSVRNLDALDLAVTDESFLAFEPCCWFLIEQGNWCMLAKIKIQEDLNNIEKSLQEAYTELVENHDISKRHYQDDVEQYMWNSQASDSFTNTHGIDENCGKNTNITLFLKGYQLEYREKHSFKELIKKQSDFMSYTISIWVEKMIKEEISNKENRMVQYFLHVVSLFFSSYELDLKSTIDIRDFYDGKNKNIGITIGVLKETAVAMQACGLCVLITKSVNVPHLEKHLGFLIWYVGYFHEDTLRVANTAVKMMTWAAKQRNVRVNDYGGTENTIKRTEDRLKLRETDDEQQQQESLRKNLDGISVSFLGPLVLYLHGWLLWVYVSFLPLHVIKMTRVTHSFLHLEDKVKVWAAGIVKPQTNPKVLLVDLIY
ncbi:unnamed protein product [Lactuca virosa]|uniref:Tr-type G domain-containing protein n=1 Tax=Lactuca virosa TaxID=75947 RepID=A0AAU9NVA1_9ASTR|nr:unnamed protein product [Lactuca virosa]